MKHANLSSAILISFATLILAGCGTASQEEPRVGNQELNPYNQATESAVEYRSELDNFEILLPQRLFPVVLQYDQNTSYGMATINNVSFHSNIGKFIIEVLDMPDAYQRSDSERMQGKINQLLRNPDLVIESVEEISTDLLPGIIIKSLDRDKAQIHAAFVDGQREYHISSESFVDTNLDQLLRESEQLIRSFKLATANADYYQSYDSRRIDAEVMNNLYPDYAQSAISLLQEQSSAIDACSELPNAMPAELILLIDQNGMVENALSSPRSNFGRCLELAYIGLMIENPPASKLNILVQQHAQ